MLTDRAVLPPPLPHVLPHLPTHPLVHVASMRIYLTVTQELLVAVIS